MWRVFLIGIVAGLLFPAGASACSIAVRSAEERVAEASVAVWGKVVARERTGDEQPGVVGEAYRYRFRVVETYKGRIRRRMTLTAHTDSAACGVGPFRVGDRFGLVLAKRRGPWAIGLGDLISRRELRSVRRPKRG